MDDLFNMHGIFLSSKERFQRTVEINTEIYKYVEINFFTKKEKKFKVIYR